MLKVILQGWHLMRIVRLVLGLIILVQGILMHDTIYGMMGAFLTFMAIVNVGCCGPAGCNIPLQGNQDKKSNTAIHYEEVDQH